MQNVTYVGQFAQVECTLDEKPKVVKHGESVEVSDEQASSLLDQPDNWAETVDPSDATVDQLRVALAARNVEIPAGAKKADLVELLAQADAPPPGPDPSGDTPPDPADTGHAN